MLDIQEITDGLPAPRDDEPPSLRQEIVDEILDHLQIAIRRELLARGGDEISATQRALQSFGDPRKIARQLWLEAMWSKIMTQRLVVVSSIFSMVVSAALVGMVGWMLHGQQQVNAALLEQMTKLVPQKSDQQPQRDQRWNNLKIKVTLGSKDGPAAKGFGVTVSRVPGIGEVIADQTHSSVSAAANNSTTTVRQKHEAATDETGLVECGYVEPGFYEAVIGTPWGEHSQSKFTVHPGRDHVEQIVAPDKTPDLTDVAINLEGLPEDLDAKKYALVLSFYPAGHRDIAGQPWSIEQAGFVGEKMPLVMVVPKHGIWISHVTMTLNNCVRWPRSIFEPDDDTSVKWQKLVSPNRLRIPAHEYYVFLYFVRSPANARPDDVDWQRNVLFDFNDSVFSKGAFRYNPSQSDHIKVVARSGELNEWTVVVPDVFQKNWARRPDANAADSSLESRVPPSGAVPFGGRGGRGSRGGFPFGISEPTPFTELRINSVFASSINITNEQLQQLNELARQRMEFLRSQSSSAAPSGEEFQRQQREKLTEFENAAVELLTPEQKAIWESRRTEMKQEREIRNAREDRLLKERNNSKAFDQMINLTEGQSQRLNLLNQERVEFFQSHSPVGASGSEQYKNSLAELQAKIKEFDDKAIEILTPDQKLIWEQRKALLAKQATTGAAE